jgi:hypothetical protein
VCCGDRAVAVVAKQAPNFSGLVVVIECKPFTVHADLHAASATFWVAIKFIELIRRDAKLQKEFAPMTASIPMLALLWSVSPFIGASFRACPAFVQPLLFHRYMAIEFRYRLSPFAFDAGFLWHQKQTEQVQCGRLPLSHRSDGVCDGIMGSLRFASQ